MKFSCNQKDISKAVTHVQRAVNSKSSIKVLEGILLKTEVNKITLYGYNTEIGIITSIDGQIEEAGEIVLNAKLLSDIVRRLPNDDITFYIEEAVTYITCGYANFKIASIPANEFPKIPLFEVVDEIEIDANLLKNMIRQVKFAISENPARPIYTGALFKIEKNNFTMVGLDGYKMAAKKEIISSDKESEFVVPLKALNEIINLIADETEIIKITLGYSNAIIHIENYSIFTNLLEGEFMDYNDSLPKNIITEFYVDTNEIIESVERVSLLLANEKIKTSIRLKISDNKINFSCATPMGKATDVIYSTIKGDDLEIGFNDRYLLDALRNCDTDLIKMEFSGSISPIIIRPKDGDDFVFLVVPARLE